VWDDASRAAELTSAIIKLAARTTLRGQAANGSERYS
jgi:hypothetical protein